MKSNVRPVVKFMLAQPGGRGKPFCGPGMIRLLDEINSTGNVRKACENINLSYSKGWKLLRVIEQCAGFPLTFRQQGGDHGGFARLTEEGKAFVRKYHEYNRQCQLYAEQLYAKIWNNDDAQDGAGKAAE